MDRDNSRPRWRRGPGTLLLAYALTAAITATGAANAGVKGAIDGVDQDGIASGWARDEGALAPPIQVHLYLDGPAGEGRFLAAVPANIPRSEPVDGSHGFRFPIPSEYRDGASHTLYAYGIANSGVDAQNRLLAGAPHTFVLDSTVIRLDNGHIEIGVEPRCGGTLVELRLHGKNLLNNYDCTGRQVQVALYDGSDSYDTCAGCEGIWGWDPVQGGDIHNSGSPLLEKFVTRDSVYTSTEPNEWYPDDKGGGPGRPVASDVLIEQTVSFLPDNRSAVRLHYRIAHLEADTHAYATQEFPAVYVNSVYDRFVSYAGTSPWTEGPVTWDVLTTPGEPAPQRYASELWAALVDDHGIGLTVYVPQQYPYVQGLKFEGTPGEFGSAANYFRPHVPFSFGPESVLEGEVYLIAGDYRDARRYIERLHTSTKARSDVTAPFGTMDLPLPNETVTGVVPVIGWVLDDGQLAQVEVMVDGASVGTALYGLSRPDVATLYPHADEQIGFDYQLDTRRFTNGLHDVSVQATDMAGNVIVLPTISMTVYNASSPIPEREWHPFEE